MPSTAREQVSREMRRLRDRVLFRWRQRVADEIPCSAVLPEAQLFNALPELYDYLTVSMATPDELDRTSLARAHGAERARQDGFGPADVLREFQVLRSCMAEIAREEGLVLGHGHLAALTQSFDTVEREALDEYFLVQRRELEAMFKTTITVFREHLNVIGISSQRIMASGSLERAAELATRIRLRVEKLETALDDLDRHDVAQPEKLPLLLSTFDLHALALEVCREANRADTSVTGDAVTGTWCRMSLRQALRILLAEGKDAAAPVSITVRQANGRAIIAVLHAHVLPQDVVRTLFSARHRETHPTLREWGVGLGFVREVAETHGGSAVVHSSEAVGTEFRMVMPIDASPFLGMAG
ncbi:ATP-binding protein [Massilia sp. METH4]|uniref:ATP-binding protein n=1 Tax=Massilia sp. METH4 TaxID=3123041 RepID=UPI0030CB26B3